MFVRNVYKGSTKPADFINRVGWLVAGSRNKDSCCYNMNTSTPSLSPSRTRNSLQYNYFKFRIHHQHTRTSILFQNYENTPKVGRGEFRSLHATLMVLPVIVLLWMMKAIEVTKKVLPSGSVDSLTRLILANALYFKESWDEKFDASRTKKHDFHLLDGSSLQVPFMTSYKNQYIAAFDGFKVLRLPYKQGEDKRHFSIYFFLPNTKDGLHSLVEKLGSEPGFLDHLLPRQKVEFSEDRAAWVCWGFRKAEYQEHVVIGPVMRRLWNDVAAREQGSWVTASTTKGVAFYQVYGSMYTGHVS
ncbi:hypothetical protein Syun_004544 [Stephania yunnanensis]|uniref:Serpin domain-containing protein n=1 Tax=Stephania yunnanensis TaxID=152371 RepID=A0AAP0Q0X1_9MAGN